MRISDWSSDVCSSDLNRSKLSKNSDVAEAMDYMLKAWPAFAAFLDDGRICLSNNAAERALRGIALGRKSWLFAGSARGGQRTAFMLSLIDRKSVVLGKSVSVRVDSGGRRLITKKKK